jgi:hypothetical protein
MNLALGLGATFIGAALVISGYSDRPIGRLLFGYWDAPGSTNTAPKAAPPEPGNASTGGTHAPSTTADTFHHNR